MIPNIIFILIDDLGWKDLSSYGSDYYETPNIDRLGKEGVRFTNAYAASPVCSPTRASCLTGRYPARIGVTQYIGGHSVGRLCDIPYFHELPLNEVTCASVLRNHGYQTWHVGKWHLGGSVSLPENHGFDINIGGCDWGYPKRGYFSPYGISNLPDGRKGEHLTDRLTNEAIQLIANRDKQRPFYLNLWHYAVHVPIQVEERLIEKYRRKVAEMGLNSIDAFETGDFFSCHHKRRERIVRRRVQSSPEYAAMLENLDTNIGRILATLDSQGIAEDTLVVFTSDNGGLATAEGSPTCNAPLSEGKGWMYEGGTRVPLIIRPPGQKSPSHETSEPVSSIDFFPSFLELAGVTDALNWPVDGSSLLPLLNGAPGLERDAIFWHYPHYSNQGGTPGATMRSGRWKLIEFFESGRLELYNLEEDIAEETNLAQDRPDVTRQMITRLNAWKKEVGAKIPEPNQHWQES